MPSTRNVQSNFDIAELFNALDSQRRNRALSWQGVARELWDQSAALNAQRDDHPISQAAGFEALSYRPDEAGELPAPASQTTVGTATMGRKAGSAQVCGSTKSYSSAVPQQT